VNDKLLFLISLAVICLPLALALGAAGLPMSTASLAMNPPKRVKVLRDKFGQHGATLAIFLGLASVLFLGLAGFIMRLKFPDWASFWLGWPLPLFPLLVCLGLAGMFLCLYRAAWQALRDHTRLRACLGLAATAMGWLFSFFTLTAFRHFVVYPTQPTAGTDFFLPPLSSAVWLILPQTIALSLSLAGSSVALYLIHRREKDDFGRDYYNYGLKLASKWAFLSLLATMVLQLILGAMLWPQVKDSPVRGLFFWGQAVSLCASSLACLLWVIVIRSQTPLRLKGHLATAWLMVWIGLSALCAAYARLFLG
jgi:MFS family permease